MNKGSARVMTLSIVAGLFAAMLLATHFLRHTLSALLTALVIAYLLNPLLKYLEKRGLGRVAALAILYAITSILFTVAILLLIPYLLDQLEALAKAVPLYVQNLKGALVLWQGRFAPYYRGEEGAWLMARADEALDRLTLEVSGLGLERLKGGMYGLFDLLLAPILVFFMLLYKEQFKSTLLKIMPQAGGCEMLELGRRVNATLEKFLLAMLLDCLLVGLLTSLALFLLGIEFPLLNGFFAGFASIVPYVGVLVAVIPPAFIGYAKSGELGMIPTVFAVYFVINVVIEGNLIKPLVMRGALELNPLVVIFAIMAMGELMGFWGIVLAIPLAAVVKICAAELKQQLKSD